MKNLNWIAALSLALCLGAFAASRSEAQVAEDTEVNAATISGEATDEFEGLVDEVSESEVLDESGAFDDGSSPRADSSDEAEELDLSPRSRTFRLGFWEIDFFAIDMEPRGTTFRLLDIRILRLFEFGFGDDYHSFVAFEMPDLMNLITTRQDAGTFEHRLADLQMIDLALLRGLGESEQKREWHFFKLPVVGSVYAEQRDGSEERRTYAYLIRDELER